MEPIIEKNGISGRGGDCQALGASSRRPSWAESGKMRKTLSEFSRIYAQRPFVVNNAGMQITHSFGLWYALRSLRPVPDFVIESGAKCGHSAWIIRQALPHVHLISFDPREPDRYMENATYLVGDAFMDFSQVDWNALGVDPTRTAVLWDDHQDQFKRIVEQGIGKGFRRFIVDDNFAFPMFKASGCLSIKTICETERKHGWAGYVRDDFGTIV